MDQDQSERDSAGLMSSMSIDNLLADPSVNDFVARSNSHSENDEYSFAHFDINDYVSSSISQHQPQNPAQTRQNHSFDAAQSRSGVANISMSDGFESHRDQQQRYQGMPSAQSQVDPTTAASSINISTPASSSSLKAMVGGTHHGSPYPPSGTNTGSLTPSAIHGPMTPLTTSDLALSSDMRNKNGGPHDTATELLKEHLAKQLQLQRLQHMQNQLFQRQIEIISGGSQGCFDPSRVSFPNLLPTPASSSEIRPTPPEFVSPMILQGAGFSTPQDMVNSYYSLLSPAASPIGRASSTTQSQISQSPHNSQTMTAPASLVFYNSGHHTPNVDNFSPLTSPALSPSDAAVAQAAASGSFGDANLPPAFNSAGQFGTSSLSSVVSGSFANGVERPIGQSYPPPKRRSSVDEPFTRKRAPSTGTSTPSLSLSPSGPAPTRKRAGAGYTAQSGARASRSRAGTLSSVSASGASSNGSANTSSTAAMAQSPAQKATVDSRSGLDSTKSSGILAPISSISKTPGELDADGNGGGMGLIDTPSPVDLDGPAPPFHPINSGLSASDAHSMPPPQHLQPGSYTSQHQHAQQTHAEAMIMAATSNAFATPNQSQSGSGVSDFENLMNMQMGVGVGIGNGVVMGIMNGQMAPVTPGSIMNLGDISRWNSGPFIGQGGGSSQNDQRQHQMSQQQQSSWNNNASVGAVEGLMEAIEDRESQSQSQGASTSATSAQAAPAKRAASARNKTTASLSKSKAGGNASITPYLGASGSDISTPRTGARTRANGKTIINPGLKPLLPGANLSSDAVAHLSAKSNHQNIIEGREKDLGLGITNDPHTGLPKKTSHKAAEQKRRDSLKCGFDDLRILLPPITYDPDVDPSEPRLPGSLPPRGPPRNIPGVGTEHPNRGVSKLALLRAANEHIVRLQRRVSRRDELMVRMCRELEALRLEVGVGTSCPSLDVVEEHDTHGDSQSLGKLCWKGMDLVDLTVDIDAIERDGESEKAVIAAARPTERALLATGRQGTATLDSGMSSSSP